MARKHLPPTRNILTSVAALAWLSACAQIPGQNATRVSDPDCPAAARAFGGARQFFADPAHANLTDDAYRAEIAALPDDGARDRRLLADLRASDAAADRLASAYGALRDCHSANGASWTAARHGVAMTEWAMAQQTMGQAQTLNATYMAAASQQLGAAAGPLLAAAFVARAPTPIHDRPADGATILAELRKGQRVLSPGDTAPGWTAIGLNDGTTGYVVSAALRSVVPNASEKLAAASLPPGSDAGQLAREFRQVLPSAQAALSASLAQSPEPPSTLAQIAP